MSYIPQVNLYQSVNLPYLIFLLTFLEPHTGYEISTKVKDNFETYVLGNKN